MKDPVEVYNLFVARQDRIFSADTSLISYVHRWQGPPVAGETRAASDVIYTDDEGIAHLTYMVTTTDDGFADILVPGFPVTVARVPAEEVEPISPAELGGKGWHDLLWSAIRFVDAVQEYDRLDLRASPSRAHELTDHLKHYASRLVLLSRLFAGAYFESAPGRGLE